LPTPGPELTAFGDAVKKVFGKRDKPVKLKKPKKAPAVLRGGRKILSLSDWHIPFERRELIEQAVFDHSDADILVINGDLLDLYAASTFSKHKTIPLLEEYNIGMAYLDDLRQKFPEVHLVRGNHEYRLERYFRTNISNEVSSLVCIDILARMANGEIYNQDGTIEKLLPFDNVHHDNEAKFYLKIGRTLFAHAHSYCKGPGATVARQADYFHTLIDFDTIVIGHTHQAGQYWQNGRMLIEQGCLADMLEYQKGANLKYSQQNNGYCVIHQDKEGNTDKRRSRVYWLDFLPRKGEY
jgi:predicted phosphodiesterase